MDCPRCHFSASSDASQCPFCGWRLSRAYTSITPAASPSPPRSAPPSPADALVMGPTPFARTPSTPTARAPVTPIQAADAFVLVPPASPLRQTAHPGLRRATRRRPSWLTKLRRSSHATAALPAPHSLPQVEPVPRLQILEMPVVQTRFEFTPPPTEAASLPVRAAAPVELRLCAGLFDALLIVVAAGFFFSLFALLGGELSFARRDLLIYLLASSVLPAGYLSLFTLFGGRTPGMQRFGLHAVGFDARPMTPERARWRAFGYLVSLGSLLLGFLWAVLDERQLTWHDYISQTFITDRPAS
ncbi:MAG TPA: RDD family protein [Candidatus Xenobia bacterium]|nr:RDD family protein [Candidatus Xenobia bacterium]